MRCIVAEDEKVMLEALCAELAQAGAIVVGAYQDPLEALAGVREYKPDLVFLDVEMPGMNGIELAERIAALDDQIQIVFVTAYEQYAIKAFELGAVYYILKPVTYAKIEKALIRTQRVQAMRRQRGVAVEPVVIGTPDGMQDRLSVKLRDDIHIIKLRELVFIKSEGGKTLLYTRDGNYASAAGLGFWEDRLKDAGFIRCHRGYIVNAEYIKQLRHILGEYRELVLDYCDVIIPVSRQKAGAVKNWLGIC